jgi:two-component system, sensor histidine kinase YesM
MFDKLKLQTSFILVFSTVIVLIIAIVYVFINNYVLREYRQAVISNATQLNVKLSQHIDFYVNDLNQLSRNSVTNQNLVNDIKTLNGLPSLTVYDNLYFDRVFESYSSYLVNYSALNTSNVHIFGRQNRFKFTYGSLPLPSNFEKIMKVPEYMQQLHDSNHLFYFENENLAVNIYPSRASLSLIRPFTDLSGSILGYIEIQQNYTMLEKIVSLETGGEVYILDAKQRFLFPSEKMNPDTRSFIQSVVSDAAGGVLHDNFVYTSHTSTSSGLTTVIKHPNEAVLAPLYTLQKATFLMIVSTVVLAILVVYAITMGLTKPIRKLRATIIKTDLDNFRLLSKYKSTSNEVNLLNDAFQQLLSSLKQSMDKELIYREEELSARLSALQGQIAPHFIHNVLYLISISAQENRVEEVVELCKSLSNMLRYIADSPFKKVTLEKEAEYTRNYLYLIQKKYEDFIDFSFMVEENAKPILLPRITIQPFVENAVRHAFNEDNPPWTIEVSCKGSPQKWELLIEDNGSGMDPDTLETLQEQIRQVLDNPIIPKEEIPGIGGLGILNTVTRLKIIYPNSLEFKMSNKSTGGLLISISAGTH